MFGIGYVTKSIEPCTRARFYETIDSVIVSDTCKLIARMTKAMNETTDKTKIDYCKRNIAAAKRQLPCITPMAYFKDNRRSVANAIPSGLNMIDVDHVDDPRALWASPLPTSPRGGGEAGAMTEEEKLRQLPFKVALVHVTPSTHGLRIIFKQPQGRSIEEAQAEMARVLNVEYDAVTKDLARCSFLVPRDYILYMNENILFADNGSAVNNEQLAVNNEQLAVNNYDYSSSVNTPNVQNLPPSQGGSSGVSSVYPSSFRSVPYSEIIRSLLFTAGYDEIPAEGERNNALYFLARNLRYICDFNSDFVRSVVPDWHLPEREVMTTIESAVKSVRKAIMPKNLDNIIQALTKQYAKPSELGYSEAWDYVVEADGIIGKVVNTQPVYLRNAAYITAMTCLGTLLTRLRGYGMNGEVLAPNFMTCVSAPQATGKSFMKRIYDMICKPIKEEDARQRKILTDIERENRKHAGEEGYEEQEFEGAIRLLPSNVSNRMLLERMDKANGQHVMIMAEEIDSITKAEKSGKWSEKSDIYRLAYDNSEWGQDYANENSYHAVVPLYMNLLFSGTPAAVSRFFGDIENGLITRFMFVDLPDTYGQKRPKAVLLTDDDKAEIDATVKRLYEQINLNKSHDGTIWMDTQQMRDDIEKLYDEVQRRDYLVNQAEVCRDLARRRYADYAVKIAMIETYINGGVYTEAIRDRVIGIINYVTEQLIAMHGVAINKSLNDSSEKHEESKKRSRKVDVLELLPEIFTTKDYTEALSNLGLATSSCRVYVQRLLKGGIIKSVDYGIYRKKNQT